VDSSIAVEPVRRIAFIGNYLPRACGIATFTFDLSEAVRQRLHPESHTIVVAMNDTPVGYDYKERVEFQIREHHQLDYTLAAEFLNDQNFDVVNLQHEFGIYGGPWGSHVISLLRKLRMPVAVTCHSVPERPDPLQREVLSEIVSLATKAVVMSDHAKVLIKALYGATEGKIASIPHGIHPSPFVESASYKRRLGLRGSQVLLSFGLLGRNKGIEHSIDALPAILAHHPKVQYVVLGRTHPVIARSEGEAYREFLQQRIEELGIGDHVRFVDEFVGVRRLLEFIGASDVCLTPYLDLDQATSGVLCYAMAMGKAVVSTPYRYAREMLSDGRGRLVPPGDPAAIARETLALLGNERAMMSTRKRAYAYSRGMTWPVVAGSYVRLFEEMLATPQPKREEIPALHAGRPAADGVRLPH